MPLPPRLRPGWNWTSLVLVLCCLVACGGPADTLEVEVQDVPAGASELEVAVTLDGRPSNEGPVTVRRNLSSFLLAVAPQNRGLLGVTLSARFATPCRRAVGSTVAAIGPRDRPPLTIKLGPPRDDGCVIDLDVNGLGIGRLQGTVAGAAFDCAAHCELAAPYNAVLSLRAVWTPEVRWGGWAGACAGSPGVTCELPVRSWRSAVSASFPAGYLLGIAGRPGIEMLVSVPRGVFSQRNGSDWTRVDSGAGVDLRGIANQGAYGFIAVGENGVAVTRKGAVWTPMETGTSRRLNDVWCVTKEDCWAVGEAGVVLHLVQGRWQQLDAGVMDELHAVWSDARGLTWIAGDAGTLRWFDGSTFHASSRTAFAPQVSFRDLFFAQGRLWAVGTEGTVLTWAGRDWEAQGSGTTSTLRAIWGDAEMVAIAGEQGMLLMQRAADVGWMRQTVGDGSETLVGMWGESDVIYCVGDRGSLWQVNVPAADSVQLIPPPGGNTTGPRTRGAAPLTSALLLAWPPRAAVTR